MVGLADENGREYECDYGTYTRDDGFKFNENINEIVEDFGWRGLVNILFHDDLWKLKQEPVKKMTLQDIERELGYRVIITDPSPEKKEVPKRKRDEIDAYIDMMGRVLGLNFKDGDY